MIAFGTRFAALVRTRFSAASDPSVGIYMIPRNAGTTPVPGSGSTNPDPGGYGQLTYTSRARSWHATIPPPPLSAMAPPDSRGATASAATPPVMTDTTPG